jgi:hypothetical protein
MRIALFALTLLAAAAGPAAAAGNEDASPFESRPTVLYGVLGLGTPVGLVGVEVEETIRSHLSLTAGVGWGAANAPQGAVMIRALVLSASDFRLTIGAGISGGKYKWSDWFCFYDTCTTKSGTVAWGNLEIGGEHRLATGFALRYFLGYGHMVGGDFVCDPPATSCGPYYENDGRDLIYLGVGVGYAF